MQYDPTNGRLSAIINANGTVVPVSTAPLGGGNVGQTVVDAAGDITQNIFDEKTGTLVRKIQTVTDGSGNVTRYIVTVTRFSYVTKDISQMSDLWCTGLQVLRSVETYAPFEVDGADAAGLRYSEQPDANSWTKQIIFNTTNNADDPARGQIISMSQRLTDGGSLQTTLYGDYTIVNQSLGTAKPQLVTVEIRTPDIGSATGYDDHVQSKTYGAYDSNGNLLYQLTAITPDPDTVNDPGGWLAEGTQYHYTDNNSDAPIGRVDQTWKITATIHGDGTVSTPVRIAELTQNVYYGTSDYQVVDDAYVPKPGAAYGAVKYSINAAGQETYYGYDSVGHTLFQYTYETWTGTDGNPVSGWVGTSSLYDTAGRLTDTYQATYLSSDPTASTHVLKIKLDMSLGNIILVPGVPSGEGGGPGLPTFVHVGQLAVDETVYSTPLRTQHIDYNSLGQKTDTIDQFGGVTSYTYDAFGNVIRTVYPNRTEVRTVYDALNRAIWTTTQFAPANSDPTSSANVALATHTIYNQLGQAIETDQFENAVIEITTQQVGSSTVAQSVVAA